MVSTLDIMAQLTAHMQAAGKHDGAAVCCSDGIYGGQLSRLTGSQRDTVVAQCGRHGYRASFFSHHGNVSLSIARRDEARRRAKE